MSYCKPDEAGAKVDEPSNRRWVEQVTDHLGGERILPDDVKVERDPNENRLRDGDAFGASGYTTFWEFEMNIKSCRLIACAPLFVSVVAIANSSDDLLSPSIFAVQTSGPETIEGMTTFESVDEYKYYAAKHVMQNNTAHTFSGRLPPMLPAVVVLRITVDAAGTITNMWVQRKPEHDDGESEIAMASMQRAGVLPRPFNLAPSPWRTLEYSETFLFNDRKQFQIRSLAPVQTSY